MKILHGSQVFLAPLYGSAKKQHADKPARNFHVRVLITAATLMDITEIEDLGIYYLTLESIN